MYAAYNECPNNGVDFEEFYLTFSQEDESAYQFFLSYSQEARWEGFSPYLITDYCPTRAGEGISVAVLLGYCEEALLWEEGRRSRPRDWQDERD